MHPSAKEMAKRLRTDLAGVNLLAMGQTVFWDEPVKAALRRVLNDVCPEAKMLVGIHDADFFSRVRHPKNTGEFFLAIHDDGPMQDLWVAAAETSQLFGSETVISRALLSDFGVPIDRLARSESGRAFLSEATSAWGWRGVAMDSSETPVCADIPLNKVLPKLVNLLQWATSETVSTLQDAPSARSFARKLLDELNATAGNLPNPARLPDLYEALGHSYWRELLGSSDPHLEFTRATRLFRFNTKTCRLPRFRFLNLFLNPRTRDVARRAYNEAVRASEIYALDRFSDIALPFDLVVLHKDKPACRGTLCVAENEVAVLNPCSTVLHTVKPPTNVMELAALIEQHLGQDVALVGKAVALVPMILSEWVFVLHQFGSVYTPLTKTMVDAMRASGLDVPLHPILRVELDAWSALAEVEAEFRLPDHLARAFGRETITAQEFAKEWRGVVARQEELLEELKGITNPEELTDFLTHEEHAAWLEKLAAYVEAHAKLLRLSRQVDQLRHRGIAAWERARRAKAEIQRLEKEKGHIVRKHIRPLKVKLRDLAEGAEAESLRQRLGPYERQKANLETRIERLREAARKDESESSQTNDAHHALEQSPEFVQARCTVAAVERESHLLRLRLVRDALLTVRGLPYASARPCWWWFPIVDSTGNWFRSLVHSAKFRFEAI